MAELKPIICTLAERPSMFNQNGYSRIDGKWVRNQPVTNLGMLKRQPKFSAKKESRNGY